MLGHYPVDHYEAEQVECEVFSYSGHVTHDPVVRGDDVGLYSAQHQSRGQQRTSHLKSSLKETICNGNQRLGTVVINASLVLCFTEAGDLGK